MSLAMAKCNGSCVIYIRTSSAANVGCDKDSENRQIMKCEAYAAGKRLKVKNTFRDPAVQGA